MCTCTHAHTQKRSNIPSILGLFESDSRDLRLGEPAELGSWRLPVLRLAPTLQVHVPLLSQLLALSTSTGFFSNVITDSQLTVRVLLALQMLAEVRVVGS